MLNVRCAAAYHNIWPDHHQIHPTVCCALSIPKNKSIVSIKRKLIILQFHLISTEKNLFRLQASLNFVSKEKQMIKNTHT